MDKKLTKWQSISIPLLLGLFLMLSTLYAYRGNYVFAYELTFLSNFLTGIFLGVTGVLLWLGKRVPPFLFLDFAVLLLLILGITVLFNGNFNMTGSMFVLHVVNPILVLAYYFIFSDQTTVKRALVLTALVMPAAYLLFSLLYGVATGNYIYFFLDYQKNGLGFMVLFLLGISVGLAFAACLLYYLNRLLHRTINGTRNLLEKA